VADILVVGYILKVALLFAVSIYVTVK